MKTKTKDDLTADGAWDLYQKYQYTTTSGSKRAMAGTMIGKYVVIFRDCGVPFYMTPSGRVTEEWRESRTYETAEDARDLILDLLRARPLTAYRNQERRGRRPGDSWDQAFLARANSARIYVIDRISPERWATNDNFVHLNLDETVNFPERSLAEVNRGQSAQTFYRSWSND